MWLVPANFYQTQLILRLNADLELPHCVHSKEPGPFHWAQLKEERAWMEHLCVRVCSILLLDGKSGFSFAYYPPPPNLIWVCSFWKVLGISLFTFYHPGASLDKRMGERRAKSQGSQEFISQT